MVEQIWQRLRSWGGAELPAVSTSALLWRALLAGAIVYALLAVYQPFGTHEARLPHKLWWLSGYGWITALAIAGVGVLARALRGAAAFRRWHLAAEFAAALIVAGSGGYLYNALALGNPLAWTAWWYFLKLAFAIGVVPIALLLFAARERVDLVMQIATPGTSVSRCTLLGENRDEKLELDIADLHAVKAADNYCEVVFAAQGHVRRRLLRGSIRAMEQQLRGSGVERVHRSWLVNLARAQKWRGNAQGGQIEIAGVEEAVPVARSYVARVRAALGNTG